MLKNTKVAMATLMAVGAVVTGVTSISATAPGNGTTPVTYDNRVVIPDGNGQYGMIIPTAISFDEDTKTGDASVAVAGINGYNLTDWKSLEVDVKVKSTNGYKLVDPANTNTTTNSVSYKVKMAGNAADFSGTTAEAVTQKLGVGGTGRVEKAEGTATLTGAATVKGQYKDTLTYSFTETANALK